MRRPSTHSVVLAVVFTLTGFGIGVALGAFVLYAFQSNQRVATDNVVIGELSESHALLDVIHKDPAKLAPQVVFVAEIRTLAAIETFNRMAPADQAWTLREFSLLNHDTVLRSAEVKSGSEYSLGRSMLLCANGRASPKLIFALVTTLGGPDPSKWIFHANARPPATALAPPTAVKNGDAAPANRKGTWSYLHQWVVDHRTCMAKQETMP